MFFPNHHSATNHQSKPSKANTSQLQTHQHPNPPQNLTTHDHDPPKEGRHGHDLPSDTATIHPVARWWRSNQRGKWAARERERKREVGMTMGRVRDRFLYARTWPASLTPKPEIASFNKRVFLTSNPPPSGSMGPATSGPIVTQIKKKNIYIYIYIFVWIFKSCRT